MNVYVTNDVISVSIFAFSKSVQNVLPNGFGYYPKTIRATSFVSPTINSMAASLCLSRCLLVAHMVCSNQIMKFHIEAPIEKSF